MKKLLFIPSLIFVLDSYSQSTSVSGTINSYASVTGIGCQSVSVNTINGFNPGDKAILIQMKGAVIDTSNSPSFGTILSYGRAGNYELTTIASASGNLITFVDSLVRKYSVPDIVQLVKVPVYTDVTVTGQLTCQPWNGSTGGVLAMVATGNVTLNADINVNGKGFRGAAISNGSLTNCLGDTADYMSASSSLGSGKKGEGIVMPNAARTNGKGPLGNGGGGGTDCNGGGAGGGNYGRGGHGGDSKCNVSCPPYFYQNSGGYRGNKLTYSNATAKIFLGGGGGCGHQNDGVGTPGTNGGGIVIIRADTLFANNYYIHSDGIDNTLIAGNDGQGGGGAGGTILLDIIKDSSLNVSAQGGYGGTDNFNGTDCHGKGGGGAGGIVWTFKPTISMTSYLSGGAPGIFQYPACYCYNTSNGATAGDPGAHLIDLVIPEGTVPCNSMGIETSQVKIGTKIYPNPAENYVILEVDKADFKDVQVTLFDLVGRNLLERKITQPVTMLEKNELQPGSYIYRITEQGRTIASGKLILE